MKYSGLGFLHLGLGLAICTIIGYWVDDYWQIQPWGILVGMLIGVSYMIYEVLKIYYQDKK